MIHVHYTIFTALKTRKYSLGIQIFIEAWLFRSPFPWCVFNFLCVLSFFTLPVKASLTSLVPSFGITLSS